MSANAWPPSRSSSTNAGTCCASGAQLAKLQELVRYWGSKYDRRKGEAKLNAFPQFKTRIDGIDCSLTKPNF